MQKVLLFQSHSYFRKDNILENLFYTYNIKLTKQAFRFMAINQGVTLIINKFNNSSDVQLAYSYDEITKFIKRLYDLDIENQYPVNYLNLLLMDTQGFLAASSPENYAVKLRKQRSIAEHIQEMNMMSNMLTMVSKILNQKNMLDFENGKPELFNPINQGLQLLESGLTYCITCIRKQFAVLSHIDDDYYHVIYKNSNLKKALDELNNSSSIEV